MVLGLYYMTKVRMGAQGEGITFSNIQEVVTAFQCGQVVLHAKVHVRLANGTIVETTVGRVLLFEALPDGADFNWVNKIMKRSDLTKLIEKIYYRFGNDATITSLDKIKKLGFYYSTVGGISISLNNLIIPHKKDQIIHTAEKEVEKSGAAVYGWCDHKW